MSYQYWKPLKKKIKISVLEAAWTSMWSKGEKKERDEKKNNRTIEALRSWIFGNVRYDEYMLFRYITYYQYSANVFNYINISFC